ncbi:glycosyltransferase family 2 protein [uncultured Jannaschia sp.]|uniref:glycosyltransferase family 2 protein n=1 Tax=uncultured Jannaschia sp. TaxID=293347 RepID=UPI002633BC6F|nr:glycosyltransferase family 2 protein [uncultured Jannaschia sp.]
MTRMTMESFCVAPEISVIVPARDEVVAIGPLVDGIAGVLADRRFELIVIDDGSTDGTRHVLATLETRHDCLVAIRNETSRGQSFAIRQGVRRARAAIVVTLDGDGQNPPDQIPRLLAAFEAPGAATLGLVQGERQARKDTTARRLAARAANALRRRLLHDWVRDSGCGMKAFRREAYLELPWFNHIHRFMPAMMLREGWNIATVPVAHRERMGGASKYSNLARALVGIPDLLGAAWLIRRRGGASGMVLDQAQPTETDPDVVLELQP